MLQVVDDDRVDTQVFSGTRASAVPVHLLCRSCQFITTGGRRIARSAHAHRRLGIGDCHFHLTPFTARNDSEPAFILALTVRCRVNGDARHELAAMGPQIAASSLGLA